MSPNQPIQSAINQSPHNGPLAGTHVMDLSKRETALVNVYQNLTGEDESHARSAFMYIFRDEGDFERDLNT